MIDRRYLPKTADAFVVALHGQLFLSLSGVRRRGGEFPKLFLAQSSPVPGVSPYLINLWSFDDPSAPGRLLGGIKGPSDRPDRDWREFRAEMDRIRTLDASGYSALLDRLDELVRSYVVSRADQFTLVA